MANEEFPTAMAGQPRIALRHARLRRARAGWNIRLPQCRRNLPGRDGGKNFTPVRRSTWAFAQGQIRFVERPDGWLLGLLIRTDSEAHLRLDPLSTEFLSVELGD